MASLDQSLKRMGLEYVDIFYHHRPDPETPLEETMGTLADIVRQGKALYVGLSNYSKQEAEKAVLLLKDMGVHCLIEQPRYNMFERTPEDGLFKAMWEHGVGCICYSPLAQGALTDKYLNGIPQGSRASRVGTTINDRYLSEEKLDQIRRLNESGEQESVAGPDGAGMGASGEGCDFRTDRGQQCETAGEQRSVSRSSGVFGR